LAGCSGWGVTERSPGEAPGRRGVLRNSLFVQTSGTTIKIGSKSPIAKFVNNGTRAHTIRPIGGKALRFRIGGRIVFAKLVRHPGTKPNRFLQRALNNKRLFIKSLLSQFVNQENQIFNQ
jgi:hypothetical protein